MAFREALAGRIRHRLARRKNVEEKKMFGGIGPTAKKDAATEGKGGGGT